MFGQWHNAKDIKLITTHNAVKWIKFMDLMGNTREEAIFTGAERLMPTVPASESLRPIMKANWEMRQMS